LWRRFSCETFPLLLIVKMPHIGLIGVLPPALCPENTPTDEFNAGKL